MDIIEKLLETHQFSESERKEADKQLAEMEKEISLLENSANKKEELSQKQELYYKLKQKRYTVLEL